jgi:hypothetical protein
MSDSRKQIEKAIEAVVLHSPTSYWWCGKQSPQLSPKVKRLFSAETTRNYLLFTLQLQLYSDFYCRGFVAPATEAQVGLPLVARTPFVEELSDANSGHGHDENGWRVRTLMRDKVLVEKEGLNLWARTQDCVVPTGEVLKTGLRLSLRFAKERVGLSPGFYMACGEAQNEETSDDIVRLYWDLTPDGAVLFMKEATRRLNRHLLPFKLKVLNDRNAYSRCDAVVVYIHKSNYSDVARILGVIHQDVAIHLKQRTPVFTKVLAPGVGLAEDPIQELSFGEHRCGLLADGIIRAFEQGKKSLQERFQVIVERFAEDGIDLEKPFLNPGSRDNYNFQPHHKHSRDSSHRVKPVFQIELNREVFLRTAEAIASRLSQEAVWHGDRCNWLGAEPLNIHGQRRTETTYRTLGPELYAGTSGVALFLAELYGVTGSVSARSTALAAIRQALSRVHSLPASARLSLYTGVVGIAFAAIRMGIVLGEEELAERGASLLQSVAVRVPKEGEFDLLSGTAGAIAALVSLRDILNDKSLLNFAVRLGKRLLRAANKSAAGYSWGSFGSRLQRNLTGFSHGAAGVGYALLELFYATGETKYRLGAERAFDYERQWFDADVGNWPDFREEMGQRSRIQVPLSFATLWCHGAPGIALSRLRAYQIIKDDKYKTEAITALQTTRQAIRSWLRTGSENYSLCHGLSGNAEVLLYGCQILGQEAIGDRDLVDDVAKIGADVYGQPGKEWPCGVEGGQCPSLMLGLAGIGHFYLRLYAPQVPSVLIL